MAQHIHLDPVGGIAGDMFIAAMVDAFPSLKRHLESIFEASDFSAAKFNLFARKDRFMTGSAFHVELMQAEASCFVSSVTNEQHENHEGHQHCLKQNQRTAQERAQEHHYHHHAPGDEHEPEHKVQHSHRTYREINEILQAAPLAHKVKEHALEIFRMIGEAEAEVHGQDLDSISFHEVGGWDSVFDVVATAAIIDFLGEVSWSCSPLPIGGGFIRCAHGLLPVPAPATALLLRGFDLRDDGVDGERVTPTGAAILKYLKPQRRLPSARLRLKHVGNGFGTMELPNMSNVLRVSVYDTGADEQSGELACEPICLLGFEVDDMTAEELAASIERLRACEGVYDVMQFAGTGKKGRIATSVQIIGSPALSQKISTTVLNEMTTLAVRQQIISRFTVPRRLEEISGEKGIIRVKVASRPDGRQTAKAEMDDIKISAQSCFEQRSLAQAAEYSILKKKDSDESRS